MKRNYTYYIRVLLWTVIVAFASSVPSYGQNAQTITGKVNDEENLPLPGVNVKVKGSANATITDVRGSFSISAKAGDVLVLSYTGFTTTEIKITFQANIGAISLKQDIKSLEDVNVVSIGYGTARKPDLTGAVSSIGSKELASSVSPTFDMALQGRAAGVIVNSNTGQPGGGVSVQIRGVGTLGNASPLYVIDGVFFDGGDANNQIYTGGAPGTNPLSTINPSDIERIDILKDASATAIYGSRGSNGVVIVTTKKGKTGTPRITFDGYYGIQQLPKRIDVMNLQEYASYRNVRDRIIFATPRPEFQDPSVLGEGTNWQKELFKNAPMQNYSLSISGGDNRTTYFMSGGYFKQEGIAIKSGFDRINGKITLDNQTTNWLKVGANLQITRTNEQINNQDGNMVQLAIRQSPDIAAVNPDGSFGGPATSEFQLSNPYGLTLISTNDRRRTQSIGSVNSRITFLKDFVFTNEFAFNLEFGKIEQFSPTYQFGALANNVSFSRRANTTYSNNTFRSYLTYNHTFLKTLKVNGVLGHESNLSQSSSVDATGSGFTSNTSSELILADQTKATSSSTKGHNALDSYYGRFNLNFKEKYLLTSTFRYDGSSKFSPDNRWNFSYAFGFAYRLSQEAFLKDVTAVSDLKLRLGYGILPNQNVADYVYGTTFRGLQTGLGIGLLLNNLQNPEAKWENTKGSNIGLDASFFKGRINLTVDAYYKNTDGLLSSLPLPLYSGTTPNDQFTVAKLTAPTKNIGSITNKGYEFSINTQNIQTKNFNWSSTLTYSSNKNKVTKLVTGSTILPQYVGTDIVSHVSVGHAVGEFYGYRVEGVYKNAQELNTHPRPVNNSTGQPIPIGVGSVWLGDIKFKDLNNDGIINEKDQEYLGSPIPKFQYGINNNFKYKAFDLTIFFNGNYGNKLFNGLKRQNEDPTSGFGLLKSVFDYARIGLIDPNGSATDVNNLIVTNPDTDVPRIAAGDANQNRRVSDRYIEDGSYIRLKNVILGYTLPSTFSKKIRLSSLRVYANVQNVFTITKYTGYDPEVGARFQSATSAGIDFGRYPSQRIYTFGISAGL